MKVQNPVAWKAYNCYNSSIGSALGGMRYLGIALNSSWDFYFSEANIGNICMAGVCMQTEHPQVAYNIARLYDARIDYYSHAEWEACLDAVTASMQQGNRPLLCVLNSACTHIPRSGRATPLCHYITGLSTNESHLIFFDSFLDYTGSFPLEALREGMQFHTVEGDYVQFKTAMVHLPEQATNAYSRLLTHFDGIFLPGNTLSCGKAVREMTYCLTQLDRNTLHDSLSALSESLRYVQYQRKYFTASLRDIKSVFPFTGRYCDTLMGYADELADAWFRLKLTLLYNMRKESPDLLQEAPGQLHDLALAEDFMMQELLSLKDTIKKLI